jgi:hypothetical protein
MDWTIALKKAAKAAVFVLVGSVVTALVSPEFAGIAIDATSGIPFVGGMVGSLLVGGIAALAVALDNWRKHWSDPVV